MTGYDGEFAKNYFLGNFCNEIIAIDRLQFTVTSRREMPNARFVEEIAKAADHLYALHNEVATTTRPRL